MKRSGGLVRGSRLARTAPRRKAGTEAAVRVRVPRAGKDGNLPGTAGMRGPSREPATPHERGVAVPAKANKPDAYDLKGEPVYVDWRRQDAPPARAGSPAAGQAAAKDRRKLIVTSAAPAVRPAALKRSRGGVKRTKKDPLKAYLNQLFRNVVLTRDGWKCRKCGRSPETKAGLVLQCAHIYSRGAHPSMTYIPENAIALCLRDHLFGDAHKDPIKFHEWLNTELPAATLRNLALTARLSGRSRGADLKVVRIFLEQEARKVGATLPDPPRIAAVRKRA